MMFTIEDIGLIRAFQHETRQIAYTDMMKAIPDIQDLALKAASKKTVAKLQKATDEEFENIDFLIYEEDEAYD